MCCNMYSNGSAVLNKNRPAAQVWNSGGKLYDRISQQIADAIEHAVDRVDPNPGDRILDLATGTGWTARRLVSRRARVVAVDISDEAIQTARELDESKKVDFQVGDAEALVLQNSEFDSVISTFGVMFCEDAKAAADEIARVCKPSGKLVLATWDNHGGVFDMFQVVSKYKEKRPGLSSPFDWADKSKLNELFGDHFDLSFERAVSYYREPCAESAWDAFVTSYGPVKALHQKLPDNDAERLKIDFIEFHRQHETKAGVLVPRPYLITCGRRKA